MRQSLNYISAVCLLFAAMATANDTTPKAPEDGAVVIISIDGLANYYLDDPAAPLPTLRAIIAEGTRAKSMRAAMPTVTWPNHTSIITGDEPARHGVVSNDYFDRETGKVVTLLWDPKLDKDQIVKVPTLYDLAKAAGLTTASICWPATRNAKTLDWTVPDVGTAALFQKYSSPGLEADCKAAGIAFDQFGPDSQGNKGTARDKVATDVFNFILQKHHPKLAMLHLIDVDHTEHAYGPQTAQAYAAIKGADADVAEVLEELKRDYAGKVTLLVVSDHGFFPFRRVILPNLVLRDAGLVEVKGPRVVGGAVRTVLQGGSTLVYVMKGEDRDKIVDRIVTAFKPIEGMGKIIRPADFKEYGIADPAVDPHAPDLILSAATGFIFGDAAIGTSSVTPPLKATRGAHGYDRDQEGMHAIFVAWGAGIQAGAPLGEIHNTDIAPTAARLLGIPMKDVDGRVLDEILTRQ